MGQFLHRLGKFAFHHAWQICAAWVVIIVVLGLLAAHFMKPASSAISIPGTEAQKTLDRYGELFPKAGKGSGRIVFETPQGKTVDAYKTQIEDVVADAEKVTGVSTAVSPFVNTDAISKDRKVAYVQVQLDKGNGSISDKTTSGIEKVVENARKDGLVVEMGGDVINKVPGEILGIGEISGVVLALIVLVVTLGSLVAAGMPLATAIVAVAVSMGGLFSLSQVIDISSTTPVLAVMLGLAVGIDYSLFIISKYRSYLLLGYSYETAVAKALGTAGNAVIFAAATVVIALAALSVVNIPFMTTMGLAGAGTVALAALVAVTLIPALLGFAGGSIFLGKTKKAIIKAQKKGIAEEHAQHSTFWYKWGEAITRRPIMVLVAALLVMAAIAWPVQHLKLGLPTDEYAAKTSSERKAYDILARGFGAGFNGPLLVLVEGLPAVSDEDRAAVRQPIMDAYNQQVAAAIAKQQAEFEQQAATVTTPQAYMQLQQAVAAAQASGEKQQQEALVKVNAQVEQYAKLHQLKLVADRIAAVDGVVKTLPALTTDNGTKGVIQVIPSSGPSDQKTLDLIANLRDKDTQKDIAKNTGVTFGVTGSTALQADINEKLANALPVYLALVVGLSFLLLIVAFRSILVPVKATIGFLLSVLTMFGALVVVFQWGWFGIADAPGPIISFIPIIAIGILFGLAMDYEFFLVSSIHEAHEHTKDAKEAVVTGFGLGSKVVTAAGFIMVAVFAGFVSNHDVTIQAMGFGLALGILVDAFVVRMTIVPAVMTLLGSSAWWLPRWLDKILPHVSIEGEEEKTR